MDAAAREAESLLGDRRNALGRALADPAELELREIEAALARVAEGTFGMCERCGGAIGRQRLRALPEARYCVSCSCLVAGSGGEAP